MITEDGICEFLKGVLEEIKPLIPPGRHNWQKAKIERTASRSSFAQSTGPNFSVSFLFQKQDHFISLEKFTKSLEGDIHFKGSETEAWNILKALFHIGFSQWFWLLIWFRTI